MRAALSTEGARPIAADENVNGEEALRALVKPYLPVAAGDVTSIGSIPHACGDYCRAGVCRFHRKGKCFDGPLCRFCHCPGADHPPPPKTQKKRNAKHTGRTNKQESKPTKRDTRRQRENEQCENTRTNGPADTNAAALAALFAALQVDAPPPAMCPPMFCPPLPPPCMMQMPLPPMIPPPPMMPIMGFMPAWGLAPFDPRRRRGLAPVPELAALQPFGRYASQLTTVDDN